MRRGFWWDLELGLKLCALIEISMRHALTTIWQFITFQLTPHTCYNLWMFDSLVLFNVPMEPQSILKNATRFGNFSIDKANFQLLYMEAMWSAYIIPNISAAFCACRTAPFNSRVVLSKLLKTVSTITPLGLSPTYYPKYTSCYS